MLLGKIRQSNLEETTQKFGSKSIETLTQVVCRVNPTSTRIMVKIINAPVKKIKIVQSIHYYSVNLTLISDH